MNNFNGLIDNFRNARILLIGDIMLDRFVYGHVSRISPEGPIPILAANKEETMLGGAGNVLANIQALGATTHILGFVGADDAAREVKEKIRDCGADDSGLITVTDRPTILKTRFLSQNQQLLRVDHETLGLLAQKDQDALFENAKNQISDFDVLIISDYGKGTLSPDLIQKLIKLAKKNKVAVIVDPKGNDFSIYTGTTIITPNRKELSEATNNAPTKTNQNVEEAAKTLIKKHSIKNVIATRSEDGMSIISKKEKSVHLPTQAQEVFDVSGAGDTVVATIGVAIAAKSTLEEAATLANVAGGLAVAKVGTAIIRAEEIKSALQKTSKDNFDKPYKISAVADINQAKEKIQKWQAQGLKVGFTNGCFDIVHYGHVNYLQQAREKCDRLVVAVNHDKSVKILKGPTRPVNDEMARATVIAALGSVDMVVFFGAEEEGQDNTPCEIVGILKPDILMKGGDYTIDQLPEGKVVLSYGGEVEIMPLYDGYSTTNIIEKSASS